VSGGKASLRLSVLLSAKESQEMEKRGVSRPDFIIAFSTSFFFSAPFASNSLSLLPTMAMLAGTDFSTSQFGGGGFLPSCVWIYWKRAA
jgi:hypothetical protein